MSQREIQAEKEPAEARRIATPPWADPDGDEKEEAACNARRWKELGYPSPEAHMVVQRRRGWRQRRKEPLFSD